MNLSEDNLHHQSLELANALEQAIGLDKDLAAKWLSEALDNPKLTAHQRANVAWLMKSLNSPRTIPHLIRAAGAFLAAPELAIQCIEALDRVAFAYPHLKERISSVLSAFTKTEYQSTLVPSLFRLCVTLRTRDAIDFLRNLISSERFAAIAEIEQRILLTELPPEITDADADQTPVPEATLAEALRLRRRSGRICAFHRRLSLGETFTSSEIESLLEDGLYSLILKAAKEDRLDTYEAILRHQPSQDNLSSSQRQLLNKLVRLAHLKRDACSG